MKFKDTIGVYKNAFNKEECELLIKQFETAMNFHEWLEEKKLRQLLLCEKVQQSRQLHMSH